MNDHGNALYSYALVRLCDKHKAEEMVQETFLLESFLLACFPITRKLLGARDWRKTSRQFFVQHRGHSPLFRDISSEFLAWMELRAGELFPSRLYLYEFMHYEWVELIVSICPDEIAASSIDPDGDLLVGHPVLNPAS